MGPPAPVRPARRGRQLLRRPLRSHPRVRSTRAPLQLTLLSCGARSRPPDEGGALASCLVPLGTSCLSASSGLHVANFGASCARLPRMPLPDRNCCRTAARGRQSSRRSSSTQSSSSLLACVTRCPVRVMPGSVSSEAFVSRACQLVVHHSYHDGLGYDVTSAACVQPSSCLANASWNECFYRLSRSYCH